jgi:hypothetical protein
MIRDAVQGGTIGEGARRHAIVAEGRYRAGCADLHVWVRVGDLRLCALIERQQSQPECQ